MTTKAIDKLVLCWSEELRGCVLSDRLVILQSLLLSLADWYEQTPEEEVYTAAFEVIHDAAEALEL